MERLWLDDLPADASNQERTPAKAAGDAGDGDHPQRPEGPDEGGDDARPAAQLRADLDVLAAHLEAQALAHAAERERLQRELRGARVEAEALRLESARSAARAADATGRLRTAAEAQEQLLAALAQQQQRGEQLQAAGRSAALALEAAQLAGRRLEQQLADARAQLLRTQDERAALGAALGAAARRSADGQAAQLRLQDEMIRSLRADLLQMEFELRTRRADADALEGRTGTRGRPKDAAKDAEVPRDDKAAGGSKKRATIRPVRAPRGADGRGSVFGSLMDLPNYVADGPDAPDGPDGERGRDRDRRGIVSRVATSVRLRLSGDGKHAAA